MNGQKKIIEDFALFKQKNDSIKKLFSDSLLRSQKMSSFFIPNVSTFTTIELARIFETLGASLISNGQYVGADSSDAIALDNDGHKSKQILNLLLPVLIHNSLVSSTLSASTNENIKFHDCLNNKIGFAFCENDDRFASIEYSFWNSTATLDRDTGSWTVNGSKCRMLKNQYDQFLIFCKVIGEKNQFNGVACFLVDSQLVSVQEDIVDCVGNEYIKINMDNLVLPCGKHQVFVDLCTQNQDPLTMLNILGKGRLISSAIVLGIMKQSLRNFSKIVPSGKML